MNMNVIFVNAAAGENPSVREVSGSSNLGDFLRGVNLGSNSRVTVRRTGSIAYDSTAVGAVALGQFLLVDGDTVTVTPAKERGNS